MNATKLRKTINEGMRILERACGDNGTASDVLRKACTLSEKTEKGHRKHMGTGGYRVGIPLAADSTVIRMVLRGLHVRGPRGWHDVASMRSDAVQCYAIAELLGVEKLAELAAHPSAFIDYAEDIAV